MGRRSMHGVYGCAHLLVGEGEEPADAAIPPFREIKPESLNEHQ